MGGRGAGGLCLYNFIARLFRMSFIDEFAACTADLPTIIEEISDTERDRALAQTIRTRERRRQISRERRGAASTEPAADTSTDANIPTTITPTSNPSTDAYLTTTATDTPHTTVPAEALTEGAAEVLTDKAAEAPTDTDMGTDADNEPPTEVGAAPSTEVDAAPSTEVEAAPSTEVDSAPSTEVEGAPSTDTDMDIDADNEPPAKRQCMETRLTIKPTPSTWKPPFDVVVRHPDATWGDVKRYEQFTSKICETVLARTVGISNIPDNFHVHELGDGAVVTIRKRGLVSGGVRALRDLETGRRASSHLARDGEILPERATTLNLFAHGITRRRLTLLGKKMDTGTAALTEGQQETHERLGSMDKKIDLLLRANGEVQQEDVANLTALEQRKLAAQQTVGAHALARSAKQRQADERVEARRTRDAIAKEKEAAAAAIAAEKTEMEALCVPAYFE